MSDGQFTEIFFIITSFATIIFSFCIAFILFQLYKVVKLIRAILERVDKASTLVADDVSQVRTLISRSGLVATVAKLVFGNNQSRRKKKQTEDENN